MPYAVAIEGHTLNTDDLTLDEAIGIEQRTGHPWTLINPFRSGVDAKEILVVVLTRHGVDEAMARARVGVMSVGEVVGAFSVAEDDMPDTYEDGVPKAVADRATTGSSG